MDNFYRLTSGFLNGSISVALVGVGGSGGFMLDSLIRLDIVLKELGHNGLNISIFDDDVVSESNVGRTKFSPLDVGQYKVEVLASRYSHFYGCDIQAFSEKFDVYEYTTEFDLIVTCTDSAQFRVDLGRCAELLRYQQGDSDILWLDMGNNSTDGQGVLGHIYCGEGNVFLPNVYDLFGEALEQATTEEDNRSSCGLIEAIELQSLFINQALACQSGHILFKLLKDGAIIHHGFKLDLESHNTSPIPINPKVWAFMGFRQAA